MNFTERIIREHAYCLWDHAGRPEGRSAEFWFAAKDEFERNGVTGKRKLGARFASLRMFVVKRQRIGGSEGGTRASDPMPRRR